MAFRNVPFFSPFVGDLDLDFGELSRAVADLRGLLARDVPLAFGMLSLIIRLFLLAVVLDR